MKSLLLALLTLALVAPVAAQTAPHKTKTKVKAPKAKVARQDVNPQPAPVLTFERGVCLGPCPVYLVSVFADGRVAYDGRMNVPVMGKKTFTLPKSAVTEMLRRTQEAHFSTLESRYSTGVTDVPATTVAVRQLNDQLKTVVVESGPPDELQNLLGYLRGQFDPLAGLKDGR